MHKKLLFLYLKLKIKNNHIEIIIRWKIGYRIINIDKNVATEIVTFRRIFLYYVFIQRACVRMMHGVQRIDSPFSALVLLLYTGKQPVSTTVRDNRKMYYLVSLLRFNCWQRYNDFVTPWFSKVFFPYYKIFYIEIRLFTESNDIRYTDCATTCHRQYWHTNEKQNRHNILWNFQSRILKYRL